LSRRRSARAFLALLALALLVHGLVALQYRADPFRDTYVSDALSYHEWADSLARDGLAAEGVFHQSPLFPLLLGQVYAIADDASRPVAALLLLVLCSSLAVALLVPLGRLFFGSTAAGIAAALLALAHGPIVFHAMKLLPVSLALATQALALVALGAARRKPGPGIALACGLAWGVAVLARAEMQLFIPVALAALWLPAQNEATLPARPRTSRLLLCLAGVLLVVAPVTLHNVRRGDLVPVASAAGENLFIGNQRGADGGHHPLHPQAGDLFSQRALARIVAEEALGPDLKPSEISAYWRGRAVEEVLASPAGWLALELKKLGRILDPGDPADIYSFPLERRRYLSLLWVLFLPPLAIWLLGLAGLALSLRHDPQRTWPLAAFAALHVAVLLLFFVSTRLRLPLLFALLPFAGLALVEGWGAWRSGRHRRAMTAAALILLLAIGHGLFFTAPSTREVLRLASVLSLQGRLDDSLEVLDPLLRAEPADPLALDQAGWVSYKRGDLERAIGYYRRAIDGGLPEGRAAQTLTRLALAQERLGRHRAAERSHDLAVAGAADNGGAYFERGMFLLRRGRRADAIHDLRRARVLAPDWPPPREALRSLGAE
jgi:tetratricopeptide (TPR) repeat protein